MIYRLVIFDFDGTLADTFPWFGRVLNGVADRYRFRRVQSHEVETLRGLGARELMKHLGVPAWKLPLIAHHMRKLKARAPDETPLFEGVPAMLHKLADNGVGLALVSSDTEANVRKVLGLDLAGLFSAYACGGSIFGKAAHFRRILRKTSFSAAETICIGDELRDLDAAHQAGLAFGAAAWGFTRPEALAARHPQEMFNHVGEIAPRLLATTDKPLARPAIRR